MFTCLFSFYYYYLCSMKRKPIHIIIIALLAIILFSKKREGTELSVLQINTWHGTTTVLDGFQGLTDIILQTNPDVVLLCEVRNFDSIAFMPRLITALEEKGQVYYGEHQGHSTAILSKYPMSNTSMPFMLDNGSYPMMKSFIEVKGKTIVCYSAHLDYLHYECYMPRGYSGTTWKKLDAPVLDVDSILEANRISYRDEAIVAFLADAKQEIEKGNLVILGGDFNEPSHLDWQADTKNLWDHNGTVINWDCSVLLQDAGYIDSFRKKYPNAVMHPGFTFPSANEAVPVSKLAWAPEADERDRIDFIYYCQDSRIALKDISIVGPSQTILRSVQIENDTEDTFIEPDGVWPTDHKGNLTVFEIR